MQQYLELLKQIQSKGTKKPAAREGMPGTTSLFGYQFRHNLAEGFPLLTTKKMFWKGIVVELLWFLRGDTNIKYLLDNGVDIWNEDDYNYYRKLHRLEFIMGGPTAMEFEEFIQKIKDNTLSEHYPHFSVPYKLGDCGFQYGKVWRDWETNKIEWVDGIYTDDMTPYFQKIDQIQNVINSLRNTPESRRHIVTAWDPAHDTDLALVWCHALFQFNCRPLTAKEWHEYKDLYQTENTPRYYLDCQLYQRSADVMLGVPFNLASYALLIHIFAKMVNMIPGDFIHTFGDVHIYDNHLEAVKEQLSRYPRPLPTLKINPCPELDWSTSTIDEVLESIGGFEEKTFEIQDYNPHPKIKAELSTGMLK